MQTRDNDKKQTEEENIRDLGLVIAAYGISSR